MVLSRKDDRIPNVANRPVCVKASSVNMRSYSDGGWSRPSMTPSVMSPGAVFINAARAGTFRNEVTMPERASTSRIRCTASATASLAIVLGSASAYGSSTP